MKLNVKPASYVPKSDLFQGVLCLFYYHPYCYFVVCILDLIIFCFRIIVISGKTRNKTTHAKGVYPHTWIKEQRQHNPDHFPESFIYGSPSLVLEWTSSHCKISLILPERHSTHTKKNPPPRLHVVVSNSHKNPPEKIVTLITAGVYLFLWHTMPRRTHQTVYWCFIIMTDW